jgi:hypothetical protein
MPRLHRQQVREGRTTVIRTLVHIYTSDPSLENPDRKKGTFGFTVDSHDELEMVRKHIVELVESHNLNCKYVMNVRLWTNGNVMVMNGNGEQIPMYQAPVSSTEKDAIALLEETRYTDDGTDWFLSGWMSGKECKVTKEGWMAIARYKREHPPADLVLLLNELMEHTSTGKDGALPLDVVEAEIDLMKSIYSAEARQKMDRVGFYHYPSNRVPIVDVIDTTMSDMDGTDTQD